MSTRRLIERGLTRKDTHKGKRDGTRKDLHYAVWPQTWGAKISLTERIREGAAIPVNEAFIFAQLYKNIENACIKARRHGLAATHAASLPTRIQAQHEGERGDVPQRKANLFKGENKRQRIGLPLLQIKV